jgi:hypothetical protein
MFTLKQAVRQANNYTEGQRVQWIVGIVPSNAPCNKTPANTFNDGVWAAIKADERAEYEAGGMRFPTPMPPSLRALTTQPTVR